MRESTGCVLSSTYFSTPGGARPPHRYAPYGTYFLV
jgi:hypothetical protein